MTITYRIASALRVLNGTYKKIPQTSAVIAAAGSSTRMQNGGSVTKQHMLLDGIPVVVRTLLTFEKSPFISEIVVVAREDEIPLYDCYREKYRLTKLKKVVAGGETRQQSVLFGFDAIDPKSKFAAIHDGARCLVTEEIIENVCRAAYRYHAAIAATAVRDTVKVTGKQNFIDATADRNLVWLAGTPQVFYSTLYRAAAYSAREDKFTATDDAQLVERIRNPVKLVECGRENIKITTPDDILLAGEILAAREKTNAQIPGGLAQ
jgi:2-C-methyl-D-erythritol 4-phosphate cytidylyltransferase